MKMKNRKSIGALALISFLSALYLWTENDDLSNGRALHRNNNDEESLMKQHPPPSLRKLKEVNVDLDDADATSTNVNNEKNGGGNNNNMCLISAYGTDGIGHQMESKLSCIAAASVLDDVVYAHHPIDKVAHGADAESLEYFFGLQDALSKLGPSIATLFDESTMSKEKRSPLPGSSQCHKSSWFDENIRLPACHGAQEEAALGDKDNKLAVFTADNCWDFFYCELQRNPTKVKHLWYSHIAPVLSEALHLSPVFRRLRAVAVEQHRQRRLKANDQNIKIVAHVRRGDAGGRQLPGSYFTGLLHKLINASVLTSSSSSHNMVVDIVIHTDGKTDAVTKEIGLEDIIETINDNDNNIVVNLQVFGRDNKSITVEKACFDMVHSDIFIASKSSFSITCGMYRNKHPATNVYPKDTKGYRLTNLGWSMVSAGSEDNVLFYDRMDDNDSSTNKAWSDAGEEFFNGLIDHAISSTTDMTMDDSVAVMDE